MKKVRPDNFKIIAKDNLARAGVLSLPHGLVETPVFMPVGTQGSVKALSPDDLKENGAQIILGNTYHLYLRPGSELIKKMGGLHKFMNWDGPILTDSGGFQAFSLGAMIEHGVKKVSSKAQDQSKIKVRDRELYKDSNEIQEIEQRKDLVMSQVLDEGVEFKSHLDGSKHLLTPEKSIQVQLDLGSDICLVLDELLSPMHNSKYVAESLSRTHRWEKVSQQYFQKKLKSGTNPNALLFGILQGVYNKDIRISEAKWVSAQGFDGVSIGGSLGTSQFWGGDILDWTARKAIGDTMTWVKLFIPENLPVHALGIGEVVNIFDCVEQGIDMFDCVSPTRRARNGSLYISPHSGGTILNNFTLLISNSRFRDDPKQIDPSCNCYTCSNFSRSYMRHLFLSKELLFYRLASIHNVHFIIQLTRLIRKSILDHRFQNLKKEWIQDYKGIIVTKN